MAAIQLARYTHELFDSDSFHIFEDFWADQSDLFWIDTVTDTGTVLIGDAASGIVALTPSDASVGDNDEVYLAMPNYTFLVAASRPLYFRALIQYAEANVSAANVAVGFSDAVAANLLVDNGGGLKASGNWFSIFKLDGETFWRAGCRNGTAVNSTLSLTPAGGAAYTKLEIQIHDWTQTEVMVTYQVDGQYLRDSTVTGAPIIRHRLLIASSALMSPFLALKNGSTTLETLNCDFIYASQLR